MSHPEPENETDKQRRRLIAATAGMGAAGMVATLIPFVESMTPSEAAKAAGAPVEADIATLEPGMLKTVEWRGKPVWILHRSDAMMARLGDHDGLLADPRSSQPQQPPDATNAVRSVRPPFLVLTGICTHLGCVPTFRPEPGTPDLGADWPGGFYCPCHGSRFDLAGRVFKNVPAPLNLVVPDYVFLSDARVLIGKGAKGGTG